MGRKKIEIKYIDQEKSRQITYIKRKGGVMKKAAELARLCGCSVAVHVFNNNSLEVYHDGNLSRFYQRLGVHGAPNERITSPVGIPPDHVQRVLEIERGELMLPKPGDDDKVTAYASALDVPTALVDPVAALSSMSTFVEPKQLLPVMPEAGELLSCVVSLFVCLYQWGLCLSIYVSALSTPHTASVTLPSSSSSAAVSEAPSPTQIPLDDASPAASTDPDLSINPLKRKRPAMTYEEVKSKSMSDLFATIATYGEGKIVEVKKKRKQLTLRAALAEQKREFQEQYAMQMQLMQMQAMYSASCATGGFGFSGMSGMPPSGMGPPGMGRFPPAGNMGNRLPMPPMQGLRPMPQQRQQQPQGTYFSPPIPKMQPRVPAPSIFATQRPQVVDPAAPHTPTPQAPPKDVQAPMSASSSGPPPSTSHVNTAMQPAPLATAPTPSE